MHDRPRVGLADNSLRAGSLDVSLLVGAVVSSKKRQSRSRKPAPKPPAASPARKAVTIGLPVFAVVVVTFVVYLLFFSDKASPPTATATTSDFAAPTITRKANSLNELLKMSPEQLDDVDIAEMNLLCAKGMPGAEDLDIDHALATLDQWAARVKHETERHLHKFARDPGNYENSEGYFRMLMLVTVLQQDLGVHYNKQRIREVDFRRSQDLFIHGMVGDDNGGTCVSMPAIYIAVARRLGYPVKLVLTKSHTFCRWDAPNGRINIEATNQGMNSFSDEYYLTWPDKVSEAEARRNHYLVSLTPAEELASFLASRGHCLIDNGRTKEALDAYAAAHRLAPKCPVYLAWARGAQRRLQPATFARREFREPPRVYRNDPMAELERINAINRANRQKMQPPMPGVPQPQIPSRQNLGQPQPYRPHVPGQPPRP